MPRMWAIPAFNPDLPTYANKNFDQYVKGDLYDWRELGITERRARQLWESKLITHEKAMKFTPESHPKPPKVKPATK